MKMPMKSYFSDDDVDRQNMNDENDDVAHVKVKQVFCQHDLLALRVAAVRFSK